MDGSRTAGASSDATLSDLTVTAGGTDLVTFASGAKTYTAMVASDVAEVTVTPPTNDSGATVAYLDGDDATITHAGTDAGHQVTLAVGDNVIKVTVTAEDTNATETYTVTVTRAAPTCTLNTGDGDLWCGVVTVEGFTPLGPITAYGFNSVTGALSDTGFGVGTNDYTIDGVWTGLGTDAGDLTFSLTSALTDDDRAKLVLHIDGSSDTFAFRYAQGPNASFHYEWAGSGLDWTSTSEVTLRLREAATPPDAPTNFTATVGDTQVTLAWQAAALDSGVTGHEFRYKTDGDYQETWTAIADSGPEETNEDSFTVTGLTNEEAHTFELRAVNTAGGGDAAEAGPVTPTPGICGRTQQIQDAILGEIADVDDCAAVTVADLATITTLGSFGFGTVNQGITSLQKGDFAGLTSLTLLNLSRNTLTSLPEGIFAGLGELTELNLSANQLESLPEGAFSDLTALTILYLSLNDLSSLDAGLFSGLTALDDLFLNDNNLDSLDAGLFSGLTALGNLYLNDNALESLPEELFSGLTALTWLYLNGNALESLPEELFSGLTALTWLYLNGNALESLPEELFSGLTALTWLTTLWSRSI